MDRPPLAAVIAGAAVTVVVLSGVWIALAGALDAQDLVGAFCASGLAAPACPSPACLRPGCHGGRAAGRLHSGHAGDQAAWLITGLALLAGAIGLVLR